MHKLKQPQKIAIIRLSAIGDIILTTPVIRAVKMKFPDAEIHFITKKQNASLVQHNPHLSKVIAFDSKETSLKELLKQVQSERYDWFIDIHKNLRSRVLRWFGNARETSTYQKGYWRRFLLLKFRYRVKKPVVPIIEKYFVALKKYGITYDNQGTEVFTTENDQQKVASLLQGIKGQPFVTICPGASFKTKQWKESGFREVAKYFLAQNKQVVFLGGPTDVEICERLAKETGGISVAGKLKLLESAALLQQSELAITNDSGMLHLAQSQKTPVVAIFGPTSEEWGFFPLQYKSKVVEKKDLACRPCHSKGSDTCPKGHFKCMNELEVEDVVKECLEFFR